MIKAEQRVGSLESRDYKSGLEEKVGLGIREVLGRKKVSLLVEQKLKRDSSGG